MTIVIIVLVVALTLVAALLEGDNTTSSNTSVDANIDSTATCNIADSWDFPAECRALVPAQTRALVLAQSSQHARSNAVTYDVVVAQGVTAAVSRTINAEINGITNYTVKTVEGVTLWFVRAARDINVDIATVVRRAIVRDCDIVDVTVIKNCTLYKRVFFDNCHIHETILVEGDVDVTNSRLVRGTVDGGGNTVVKDVTVKDSSFTVDVVDNRPLTIDVEAVVEPSKAASAGTNGSDRYRFFKADEKGDIKIFGKRYHKGTAANIKVLRVWPYMGIDIEIEKGYYPLLDDIVSLVRVTIQVHADTFKTNRIRIDLYGGDCANCLSLDSHTQFEEAGFTVDIGYLKPIA